MIPSPPSPYQVSPLLSKILLLLTSFIQRPHQSLAAIGVAAFVRLMSNAGALFSEQKWEEVRGRGGVGGREWDGLMHCWPW